MLLSYVLKKIHLTIIICYDVFFSVLKKCVKIGEGVYGEVFRTNRYGQSVALKVSLALIFGAHKISSECCIFVSECW